MKKYSLVILVFCFITFCGCSNTHINIDFNSSTNKPTQNSSEVKELNFINPEGMTIAERINLPEGFKRVDTDDYGKFIRNLPLLPDKSPVLLYDGSKKGNQNSHLAVIDIDVGKQNLQQCADSILRVRCEYLFATKQFEKINYHLTNGFELPYTKYRDGYRLKVDGNNTTLLKTAEYDDSYEVFRKYLTTLFCYAGTLSLDSESVDVDKDNAQIGDIFITGGSPGHCVMIMDMCRNEQGEKKFILGQGYMPAQQMQIIKQPNSSNPWYSLDELLYPFVTSEYTFNNKCLKRVP